MGACVGVELWVGGWVCGCQIKNQKSETKKKKVENDREMLSKTKEIYLK